MSLTQVEALLFDVGGVVVRIDFGRAFARWGELAGCDPALLRTRFSHDTPYQRHERGEIDAAAYFAKLRGSLGVALGDARLLEGWNTIFVEEMPGISDMLARLGARIPLYAFANTNHAHWAQFEKQFASAVASFRKVFTSCTIGLRKPESAAFDHVVAEIGVPPNRILLFDDTLENIDGARACGLQAVHVMSDSTVSDTVARLGLVN